MNLTAANGNKDIIGNCLSDKIMDGGINKKQFEKASPQIEIINVEKLNWLIHLHHIRKDIVLCKELIKAEIKRTVGQNEYVFYKQGEILKEEGKIQEALEAFQACIKLNPNNADYIKEVANCLFQMHRFRLALEAYLEAARINSKWEILYNIGECYLKLGDLINAKDNAYRAVQFGKHEKAYNLLIKILILDGDIKTASIITDSAVESCADSVSMLCQSGLLHMKLGETQIAFERFSSALALDPSNAKALLGIGCITQSYGEYDVALNKYKLAVTNEPNSLALWNNIGICFYSKQKFIAAISCLKRALWLSPLNWRLLFNLGLVYLSTEQFASAFNFLCASVNLRSDSSQTFLALGYSLFHLNDAENALRSFKQALILTPDDPLSILNNLVALIIINKGFHQNTDDLYKKLLDLLEKNAITDKEMINMGEYIKIVYERESSKNKETQKCGIHENAEISTTNDHLKNDLKEQQRDPDEV